MIITFTPVRQIRCQYEEMQQGCMAGSRSFCSPTMMIINHVGRPPESDGVRTSGDSPTAQASVQENDPVATQIPDEAQLLLDEVLNEIDSEESNTSN